MEPTQTGFWNSSAGVALRWIALVPVSLLAFGLAEALVFLVFALLGALGAPLWALVLIVLFLVHVLIMLFGSALYGAVALVAAIAPKASTGLIIVGSVYGLLKLIDVITWIGIGAIHVVITKAIIMVGLLWMIVVLYAEKTANAE